MASVKEIPMSGYEEDDRFQPIAPIEPIRRIRAVRAIRQMRPYLGNRNARPVRTNADLPEEPSVILDISPQAREQAHHPPAETSDDSTSG